MTALTPRKAQELKDAFDLARDLRSAFPQDALHVLEELYSLYGDKRWTVGPTILGYKVSVYLEIAGVQTWLNERDPDAAPAALRRWIDHALQALRRYRESQNG